MKNKQYFKPDLFAVSLVNERTNIPIPNSKILSLRAPELQNKTEGIRNIAIAKAPFLCVKKSLNDL